MYDRSNSQVPKEEKTMIIHHLAAIILAFFLDLIIGDPPGWPHPVKWMGALIAFLTKN